MHVETGQVKPEDVHGFPQPGQPVVGKHALPLARSDAIDDVEVRSAARPASGMRCRPRSSSCSGWLSRISAAVAVSRPWMTRKARRYGSSARAGSSTGIGQCGQLVADLHQPRRHRQFLFQRGDFDEVVRQRGVGGAAGGQPDHVGGDVGVAVAVAADPRAGPQDRLVEHPASGWAQLAGPGQPRPAALRALRR